MRVVIGSGKPVPSIEVDNDSITGKYSDGDWMHLVASFTSHWVASTKCRDSATIWFWEQPSLNFGPLTNSIFLAEFGLGMDFFVALHDHLKSRVRSCVRFSDYVVPSPDEGWFTSVNVENGVVWLRVQSAEWVAQKVINAKALVRKLRDSSKTRVAPLFKVLEQRTDDWPSILLNLAASTLNRDSRAWQNLRMSPACVYFGDKGSNRKEKGYAPSEKLLEWLITNLTFTRGGILSSDAEAAAKRQLLLDKDHSTQLEALELLKQGGRAAAWCRFEGMTYPDAVIETPDAIIVVEGKRTETGPTTMTTWMSARHQMLRHIDGAFDNRGGREVFGLFIVEAAKGRPHEVPKKWVAAAKDTASANAINGSLPHRTESERSAIADAFIGVTTWTAVCRRFGIDESVFPETTQDFRDPAVPTEVIRRSNRSRSSGPE